MDSIIDITTGLVSAAMGAFIAFCWSRFLYPLWVELSVESTKLHDQWRGNVSFGDGITHEISLVINKLGRRVTGSLRFTEGTSQGQQYKITGQYSQGFLAFTYSPEDRGSISQGAATFKRIKDGNELEGAFSYNDRETDKISTTLCRFTKA